MPYNPGGIFSLVASYFANPGTTIRTEQHNPVFEDVGSALSQVLIRDGRAPMTGPLNMNGFPINSVAAGTTSSSVATLGQAMPIGAVINFAGASSPAGWMLCYGQPVSRTTYSTLFAIIGTTYGTGDGSTTFNLPDLRGSVVAGFDSMGGAAGNRLPGAFGSFQGASAVGLAEVHLPFLTKSINGDPVTISVTSAGSPGGFLRTDAGTIGVTGALSVGTTIIGGNNGAVASQVNSTGPYTPSGNVSFGAGQQHPNVQPTLIMNKIIRVSYDG